MKINVSMAHNERLLSLNVSSLHGDKFGITMLWQPKVMADFSSHFCGELH